MTSIYIANTDNNWFDFLKSHQPLDDVNFWKPSAQVFKAIDEGELFVFRLKSPRNVIGGYGILVSSINVSIQLAWDSLGIANGHNSIEDMITAIRKYRTDRQITPHTLIGCRVLSNPVFLEPHEWFEIPKDWSNSIVTGKVYDTGSDEGRRIFQALEQRTNPKVVFERDRRAFDGLGESEQARYGAPTLIAPRLGQGAFRLKVTDAYEYQCALSDTKVLPALEAAHIQPYSMGGSHSIQNGVLFRKDIHSVFDAGFATITDDLRFHVSQKIKEVFNNGNEYRRLHGQKLRLPKSQLLQPSLASLRWHQSERFVGDN